MMSIQSVSRAAFDRFQPSRSPIAELMVEEVEWFKDDAGTVLGVIARDKSDDDFSIAVLGRDERSVFRAIDAETCIATLDEARGKLLSKMDEAVATGEKVFPQGD